MKRKTEPGTILCHCECMYNKKCPYPKGQSPCDTKIEARNVRLKKKEYEFHS